MEPGFYTEDGKMGAAPGGEKIQRLKAALPHTVPGSECGDGTMHVASGGLIDTARKLEATRGMRERLITSAVMGAARFGNLDDADMMPMVAKRAIQVADEVLKQMGES